MPPAGFPCSGPNGLQQSLLFLLPSWPFRDPHLALQPHCLQLGTCHSRSSILEGPPLARNCSLYFVEYFIIFFFFLSLVGTVTPALLS